MARRQSILCTYDAHETGVVEDGIDGGVVVAGALVQPGPSLAAAGGPGDARLAAGDCSAPDRENHIMRSTSVVRDVRYGKGRIAYSTFDAPAPSEDVLRLAFTPTAGLGRRQALAAAAGRCRKTASRSSRCPTATAS